MHVHVDPAGPFAHLLVRLGMIAELAHLEVEERAEHINGLCQVRIVCFELLVKEAEPKLDQCVVQVLVFLQALEV